MDNIVSVKLDSRYASTLGVWQYDYGQVLRITGLELPPAVEVQFSLDEKSGETLSRVGTTVDGVTEVKIPDELFRHSATSNYRIYAYIYLTDETSGNTKCEITIPVRVRSKPTSPAEDPETDPDLFRETVVAVNASAKRAENAASSAMKSAASADETLAEIKRVADGISGNIENANTMKSELSDMINNAGIEKKELESSIGKAGEAKMALDSSIRSAGEKQLALDATVEHANTVDASLKERIGSAEQIQENVEQIAKNKADISSLNEDIVDLSDKKITKFYASNQGENHLADSDNGKIQDMVVYGKSSQNKTTGKNLLKIKDATQTIRGITITSKDGIITVNGTATETGWAFVNIDAQIFADGTYIVSYESNNNNKPKLILANAAGVKVIEQNIATALSNAEIAKVCFVITKDKTYNMTDVKVQLELGSSATPYEPYTGGIPSPSPDYPQEIKSVVNPTIKVCGKNLLQPNLRYGDRAKINIKKGAILTLICKNGIVSPGGNLKFEKANGEAVWFGFDKGNVKQQITLRDDVIALNYLISQRPSESYALYIGDGNTYEPYKEQSIQLPITLNAIPVTQGGNVTIDGQQYVADYVDVERGKLVRMCERVTFNTKNGRIDEEYRLIFNIDADNAGKNGDKECIFSTFKWESWGTCIAGTSMYIKNIKKLNNELYTAQELKELSLDFDVIYQLSEKQETDLTTEQTQALKELSTYYPVTNIIVDSEQLYGYTVFNYPISMKNGWDYVKKQLNDNRDYIYDMDAKTQDIDTQSAEAYVNSEYAVALTELEV